MYKYIQTSVIVHETIQLCKKYICDKPLKKPHPLHTHPPSKKEFQNLNFFKKLPNTYFMIKTWKKYSLGI